MTDATAIITEYMGHDDARIRGAVTVAFAQVGNRAALDKIIDMGVSDDDPMVRVEASQAAADLAADHPGAFVDLLDGIRSRDKPWVPQLDFLNRVGRQVEERALVLPVGWMDRAVLALGLNRHLLLRNSIHSARRRVFWLGYMVSCLLGTFVVFGLAFLLGMTEESGDLGYMPSLLGVVLFGFAVAVFGGFAHMLLFPKRLTLLRPESALVDCLVLAIVIVALAICWRALFAETRGFAEHGAVAVLAHLIPVVLVFLVLPVCLARIALQAIGHYATLGGALSAGQCLALGGCFAGYCTGYAIWHASKSWSAWWMITDVYLAAPVCMVFAACIASVLGAYSALADRWAKDWQPLHPPRSMGRVLAALVAGLFVVASVTGLVIDNVQQSRPALVVELQDEAVTEERFELRYGVTITLSPQVPGVLTIQAEASGRDLTLESRMTLPGSDEPIRQQSVPLGRSGAEELSQVVTRGPAEITIEPEVSGLSYGMDELLKTIENRVAALGPDHVPPVIELFLTWMPGPVSGDADILR